MRKKKNEFLGNAKLNIQLGNTEIAGVRMAR